MDAHILTSWSEDLMFLVSFSFERDHLKFNFEYFNLIFFIIILMYEASLDHQTSLYFNDIINIIT